jgi:uncharacterized membrane protein
MTNWTDLADASARAAFSAYFLRVERLLAPLPSEAASQVRRELEAHALDLLSEQGGKANEALSRLGPPEDFVPDLVAEKLRSRAAKSFAPTHVAAAIVSSARTGVTGLAVSTLAGTGYFLAAFAVAMGIARLVAPETTGLFRLADGRLFLGFGETLGGVDVLGVWFAPVAFAAAALLYVILTLAFGRARLRKRPQERPEV